MEQRRLTTARLFGIALAVMIVAGVVGTIAADPTTQSRRAANTDAAKRARPPKWSADVSGTFFDDAREKLVGPRPEYEQTATVDASMGPDSARSTTAAGDWSKLIDAETVETEIKRLAQ